MPLIMGTLGMIKEGKGKYLHKIPDSPSYMTYKNCTL